MSFIGRDNIFPSSKVKEKFIHCFLCTLTHTHTHNTYIVVVVVNRTIKTTCDTNEKSNEVPSCIFTELSRVVTGYREMEVICSSFPGLISGEISRLKEIKLPK